MQLNSELWDSRMRLCLKHNYKMKRQAKIVKGKKERKEHPKEGDSKSEAPRKEDGVEQRSRTVSQERQ